MRSRIHPFLPNILRFTPPPNAIEADPRRRTWLTQGVDSFDFIQANHEQLWEGDTLVERQRVRANGSIIGVERRLTLSEDRRELKISERIIGPKGEITRELLLPLA
jgi:hypothetical protein